MTELYFREFKPRLAEWGFRMGTGERTIDQIRHDLRSMLGDWAKVKDPTTSKKKYWFHANALFRHEMRFSQKKASTAPRYCTIYVNNKEIALQLRLCSSDYADLQPQKNFW